MTKGKTMPVLLILSVMEVLCTGCSIKEDRSLCPCALVLDFSNVEESIAESSEVHLRAADGFLYSDPDAADGISGGGPSGSDRRTYSVRVPKTRVAVSVVSGAGSFYSADYGLRIPLGEECPPVHMYYSEFDAVMEKYEDVVRLYKDYCRITVRMLPSPGDYPFTLTLKGGVCGIGRDRTVVPGDFSYAFVPASDGAASVNVPRQTDDSLILQIRDGDRVLREFAVGEYIAESGYDWTAADLEDIDVSIDYANSYLTIKVDAWSASFAFDVII